MTVLVTGGAGYIGGQVVLALRDAGWPVLALNDLSAGRRAAVPDGVPLITGDVADRNLLDAVFGSFGIEAVVHLAGSVIVPESVREPLAYYANNVLASHGLLGACVAAGVRAVVFSSTAAVYGQPEVVPVGEDAPQRPINPYGRSKLMAEWMLRDVDAAHGLPHAVLRYFNVAGADPEGRTGLRTPNATHLIKVACEVALGRRPVLRVFGTDYPTPDGTCIRDFIHVADLAAAHVEAIRYLLDGGMSVTLNCGYGRGFSVREVVADSRRIVRELNWRPELDDLDTIVAHALAWERRLIRESSTGAADV